METTERHPEWLRLSEIVTAATVIAGGLSALSYAFALGYIFAIEPRFLPAFGFGDLLLLFLSSTSTTLFAAIALLPSVGMFFSVRLMKSFLEKGAKVDANEETDSRAVSSPAKRAMTLRRWVALTVSISVTAARTCSACFRRPFPSLGDQPVPNVWKLALDALERQRKL